MTPEARLAKYRGEHPAVVITEGRGGWRAWIPDAPDSFTGTELRPYRNLGDLLDRLDELDGMPGSG